MISSGTSYRTWPLDFLKRIDDFIPRWLDKFLFFFFVILSLAVSLRYEIVVHVCIGSEEVSATVAEMLDNGISLFLSPLTPLIRESTENYYNHLLVQ